MIPLNLWHNVTFWNILCNPMSRNIFYHPSWTDPSTEIWPKQFGSIKLYCSDPRIFVPRSANSHTIDIQSGMMNLLSIVLWTKWNLLMICLVCIVSWNELPIAMVLLLSRISGISVLWKSSSRISKLLMMMEYGVMP